MGSGGGSWGSSGAIIGRPPGKLPFPAAAARAAAKLNSDGIPPGKLGMGSLGKPAPPPIICARTAWLKARSAIAASGPGAGVVGGNDPDRMLRSCLGSNPPGDAGLPGIGVKPGIPERAPMFFALCCCKAIMLWVCFSLVMWIRKFRATLVS